MGAISGMNFAAFDLNLLRVFDALMRERSVTRAGEQIGLSQPAVSQALNRLRGLLDDQLFVRRGPEMVPTPKAETMAAAIRNALALVEDALIGDRAFEPARAQRTYTILASDFFSSLVMPEFFATIAAEAPGVRLRMVDSALGDVERLLQEDAVDLAVERPLTVAEWVSRELVFTSSFSIIAAKNHPQIAAAGVTPGGVIPLDLFCALPHAIRSIDGSMSGWTDEALAQVGRERRVVLALPHFASVSQAVARGELIAAIPSEFAAEVGDEMGLEVYAAPVAMGHPEISMYWHSRHDRNPAHAWLRDRMRDATARFRP